MKNDLKEVFSSTFWLVVIPLFVLLAAAAILRAYFPISGFLGPKKSGEHFEVSRDPENLPPPPGHFETLSVARLLSFRQMLRDGRFDALTADLEELQREFEKDPSSEYKVHDAYQTLGESGRDLEPRFAQWIERYPDRHPPHLAAACYASLRGWEERGARFAKETPEENFRRMRSHFARAEEHANAALLINPNLLTAYDILIGIRNAGSGGPSEDRAIQEALKRFPRSFLIRSTCCWAKEPRWGGSYREMENIAREAETHLSENPRLAVLYGYVYCEQGRVLAKQEQFDAAMERFDRAFSYGDDWYFHYRRARFFYYDLEQYDRALADIEQAIAQRPVASHLYLMRSRINFALEAYPLSREDLQTAEMLYPRDKDIAKWRDWAVESLVNRGHRAFKQDLSAAVGFYDEALRFDDVCFEALYWRGTARYRLEEYDAALSDFERAVELNPAHFKSVQMIDYILAREQQWERILSYWDRFLELEPNHAEAYFERSGTYHHYGDRKKSLADLEKACRLGHEKACRMLKKMGG